MAVPYLKACDGAHWLRQLSNDDESYNDAGVLRLSCIIYGSVFVGAVVLFSWARRKFPKAYNIRSWVDELKTYLADDQPDGFFAWIFKPYEIEEDEFLAECGFDALCAVRLLRMGSKMSLVGLVCMVVLLPLYYTADESSETQSITDPVVKTTISNVPSSDSRLFATVLASYFLFGVAMRLLLTELNWFIEKRHIFLRQPRARHFAVFVRNIPRSYRTNKSLKAFFEDSYAGDTVLEAIIPRKSPNLDKAVANRSKALDQLEHALALFKRDKKRPRHKEKLLKATVDSIDYYTEALDSCNVEVSRRRSELEAIISEQESETDVSPTGTSGESPSGIEDATPASQHDETLNPRELPAGDEANEVEDAGFVAKALHDVRTAAKHGTKRTMSVTANATKGAVKRTTSVATGAAKGAAKTAKKAVALVAGGQDGEVLHSGFVVFRCLSSTCVALQIVHHSSAFEMEVLEAPDPGEVLMINAGRTHKDLQIGKLSSMGLISVLCLVWTIPTSFIASLSSATAVRDSFPALNDLFDKYPALVTIIEQLAPLALVILNAILPKLVKVIALMEGHISSASLEDSIFRKLAYFQIIQTFFVSALSGGIIQSINDIIDDPTSIIDLLANSLPTQSTYFFQVTLVYTVRGGGMELLRVFSLVWAYLRRFVGPRLTERERSKKFWWMRPLSDPDTFTHSEGVSDLIFVFMVLFVYTVISPMTPLFTLFCFASLETIFRNQFCHIYPKDPDSGGKIWVSCVQFLLACMIIAEFTILGLLGLKKAAKQVPFFIPLIVITFLFNLYVQQAHFRVSSFLPSHNCLKEDQKRSLALDFDFSFVQGAYLQPSLTTESELQPDRSLRVSDSDHQTPGIVFENHSGSSDSENTNSDNDAFYDASSIVSLSS